MAGLVFADDYPKFPLRDSAIWPIIEHMNESREDELAVALPSNTRTLFDTLAAARKARIAAEALELEDRATASSSSRDSFMCSIICHMTLSSKRKG